MDHINFYLFINLDFFRIGFDVLNFHPKGDFFKNLTIIVSLGALSY